MNLHPFRYGTAASAALFIWATAASAAPDAKAVADSLVAAATAAGSTASYEAAAANGDDVVVTNFKTTQRGATLTVPSLVIAAPVARPEGGFTSPHVTFDNVTGTKDNAPSMSWQTGVAEDAILLTPEEVKARATVRPFRSVRLTGIKLASSEGAAPVTIDEVVSDFGDVKPGEPRGFAMRAGPIKATIDVLADTPNYRHVLELLGYSDLTVNVASEGGYDDKTDTLFLRSFSIDTANVGKLTVSGKFSGMSLGRIAVKDDSVGTTAQAKLDNLQVHFANSGIVERVIDMQANATGSTRDEVIEQATAVATVTFMLAGNIAFSEKIATAVGTFLADPKTLTFTATPATPVTIGKIFAAAIGAQETLPDLLGVDVKANEP
ncbi:MAG: hypothetical protein ABI399_01155 [Bauldia sp.]